MPIGVAFRIASKVSLFRARRGTDSPPTAFANSRAAFSRRAQITTRAPAFARANAAALATPPAPKINTRLPASSKFFLEGAQNPEVIGIAPEERAIAPDHHSIDGANLGGERIALFQVFQDGLFVRNRYAEAANAELRNGPQKITKIFNQEGQIDGIDFARDKAGVVQERRQGVPNWIANHPVNASAPGQLVSAIEMLQGVQGNLAGGRRLPDGSVGQRAAFAQSKDTRRKTKLAHGDRDETRRASNQTQEAKAVSDGFRVGRNF